MVVLFARELASRGRSVSVYCSLTTFACTDIINGHTVDYYRRSSIPHHNHQGTLIAFKDPDALFLTNFKQKYLWTADRTHLSASQRRECKMMVAISKWHKSELSSVNIGYPRISCIEPGIVISEKSEKIKRIPKQCLYASSPDRGLDYLRRIWPLVLIPHPDATLIVTYSKFKQKSMDSSGQFVDRRYSNEEMIELYQQSDILAYPCSGQERYCITAAKAQLYGTIPCVIPHMALQDTVQFGIKSLKSDYLNAIIKLLDDDSRDHLREVMINNYKYNTWSDVVDQWEQIIGEKAENQNNP
jgi:hypothetical protein